MTNAIDLRVAISVMAYPVISTRHGEVVCVAGFDFSGQSTTPRWIRLYPFRVREAAPNFRVKKWDIVDLYGKRGSDQRPESYVPNMESIKVVDHLGTKGNWAARRRLIEPHRGKTMVDVEAEHTSSGSSLAVAEPGEILDLEVTKRPEEELRNQWNKSKMHAAQGDLFSLTDRKPLEPIPFDFHFVAQYPDELSPRRLKVIDWEINQAYRRYRAGYPRPEQVVRERWLRNVCGPDRDPVFLVGNQWRFPKQWLLLSIVWPRATKVAEPPVADSLF